MQPNFSTEYKDYLFSFYKNPKALIMIEEIEGQLKYKELSPIFFNRKIHDIYSAIKEYMI